MLLHNGTRIGKAPWLNRIVGGLFWHLTREIYSAVPPTHLALHAAVVELDGKAILLPGPTGTGKSTLTAHLVQSGMGYVTDDLAFIEIESLRVEPYPKPISLERGSWGLFRHLEPPPMPGPADPESAWQVAPDRAGRVWNQPLPIGAILFLSSAADGEKRCDAVAPAQAAGLLAQQAFGLHFTPTMLRALSRMARCAPCFRVNATSMA